MFNHLHYCIDVAYEHRIQFCHRQSPVYSLAKLLQAMGMGAVGKADQKQLSQRRFCLHRRSIQMTTFPFRNHCMKLDPSDRSCLMFHGTACGLSLFAESFPSPVILFSFGAVLVVDNGSLLVEVGFCLAAATLVRRPSHLDPVDPFHFSESRRIFQ